MSESTFTIRVDDHLKEAFSEAARMKDRTGAQLVRDFMRDFVQAAREKDEYELWFKAKVEAGLQAVQEGRVISHEDVKARAQERRERLFAASGKYS